jgi:hypothetical protein
MNTLRHRATEFASLSWSGGALKNQWSCRFFLLASLLLLWGSCAIAISFPIQCSMVAVFALAGPHNWMEARYFLTRYPARWGKLQRFFGLSIFGILGLTLGFAAIPWLGKQFEWGSATWLNALTFWNLALVAWVYALVTIRAKQPPRRDWHWAAPIALSAAGLAFWFPGQMSVLWIYLHPLVGLWILDREILRSRPHLSITYRMCLATLPLLLLVIVGSNLHADINEPGRVIEQIVAHSGAAWVPWVSSQILVSLHAFLELIHYGVWLIAIPFVSGWVWKPVSQSVPLAKRSPFFRRIVVLGLAIGCGAIIALWIGFQVDYVATRDLYFTIAMAHVLAEVPFLLRSL